MLRHHYNGETGRRKDKIETERGLLVKETVVAKADVRGKGGTK